MQQVFYVYLPFHDKEYFLNVYTDIEGFFLIFFSCFIMGILKLIFFSSSCYNEEYY